MAAISALASFELLRATGVAHHNGMYFCTALAAAAIPLGEWLGQEGMVLQASALLLMVAIFWIASACMTGRRRCALKMCWSVCSAG